MGLIIVPFIFGCLGLSVFSIFLTARLFRKGQIFINELILGVLFSMVIFSLVSLSYVMEGNAWGLSPFLRIPFFVVICPFIFFLNARNSRNELVHYIGTLALISIAVSGIFGVVFFDFIFGIIEFLGVKTHY